MFPPRASGCPNPGCGHDELDSAALSRTGTLWSYSENRYQPPPPFPQTDPFEPYALAAVSLATEGIIVLGKVVAGSLAADLTVGQAMELAIEPLYRDDDGDERTVWAWKPVPR